MRVQSIRVTETERDGESTRGGVAGFMWLLFTPPETQKSEALQAQQAKKRYEMERQMAYVRTSCEQISFESLEREMRGKGEQLMAEYRNQLNTLETE